MLTYLPVCVSGRPVPPVRCVSTGCTERLPAGSALSALLLQSMLGAALHRASQRRHGSGWVLCSEHVCVCLCNHPIWCYSGRVILVVFLVRGWVIQSMHSFSFNIYPVAVCFFGGGLLAEGFAGPRCVSTGFFINMESKCLKDFKLLEEIWWGPSGLQFTNKACGCSRLMKISKCVKVCLCQQQNKLVCRRVYGLV